MNTTEIIKKRYAAAAEPLKKALALRGYDAYFCADRDEARKLALSLIETGSSVSWGGSMSVVDCGIIDALKLGDYTLFDRDSAKTPDERTEITKKAYFADWYLASVNALSEDGTMINVDGMCNRISAIAFGPKRVILVVGMNKLCPDAESARARARSTAAPANATRLSTATPCAADGVCHNCNSPACICSQIVEMRRSREPGRISVILVGESLGL